MEPANAREEVAVEALLSLGSAPEGHALAGPELVHRKGRGRKLQIDPPTGSGPA